jgi:hypothetical protein
VDAVDLYFTPLDEDGTPFDDFTETVRALPLADCRFQLLETPVWSDDFTFGDIVAAHVDDSGRLKLGQVLTRSDWRTWRGYSAPRDIVESQEFADLLDAVAQAGGHCQIDSGGFEQRIEFSFPPESDFDPEPTVAAIFTAANTGSLHRSAPGRAGSP